MMVKLNFLLCFFILSFLCDWNFAEGNEKDGCPKRDRMKASAVGRRCRKSCDGKKSCGKGRQCLCAHECGWSCIRQDNPCHRPPAIENMANIEITRKNGRGQYLPASLPYRFDDTAKYVCQPGYRLHDPNVEHLCTGRKVWTNIGSSLCTRACRRRNYRRLRDFKLTCTDTCVTDGDCSPGNICQCDGYCGRSCVNPDVDCGEAPESGNATIVYDGSGFNRVVYYSCNDGFYISSGTPTRKCTAGGKWDGRAVICERVQCVDPQSAISDQDGYISEFRPPPYYVGDKLRFECRPGYNHIGAKNRTCLSNGKWSGVDTVCDRKRRQDEEPRCNFPGVPIGGQTIPRRLSYRRFMVNDTVRFQCDRHLVMVGEAQQECLYFGQWSGGGAPQCVDPRYRDSDTSVITKLAESSNNIKNSLPKVGRFIGSGADANHEIYFLFDLSNSVSDIALNNSLTFAVKLIQRLSANASGIIEYGVMVFASEPMIIVDTHDVQPTVDELIEKIINIGVDRQSIQGDIRSGTHTAKVLRVLASQLEFSYAQDRNGSSKERHVFILTDGQHNEGGPPQIQVDRLRARNNPPTFYSITSCVECASEVTGGEAYSELLGLAGGKLENYIVISNFYLISELLDRVTDARINYGECGQAGDVGSVKQQARIGRVIGGTRATTRSWPWQVAISLRDNIVFRSYAKDTFYGGGSLINNRWVLTAAHLFDGINRGTGWEEEFLLTFGMHKLPLARIDLLSAKVKVFTCSKIIEHDDFGLPSEFNLDVALMKIGQEYEQVGVQFKPGPTVGFVNYTEYIRPVCMPCVPGNCVEQYLLDDEKLVGTETFEERCAIETEFLLSKGEEEKILAVATGFGHTEERQIGDLRAPEPSPTLQQGLHRIRNDEHCATFTNMHIPWGGNGIPYTGNMLCATSGIVGQNIDSCQGDSGGPLVREISYVTENEKKTCWVQIGIVSWGWGCGQSLRINGRETQVPGYYTNVMAVSSWIKTTLEAEEA